MTAEPIDETTNYHEVMESLATKRLFTEVPLDELSVDLTYQREITHPKRIRDMAARYDERLMGVVICSVRPDGIYVIDGHHRLAMARLLGHKTILCELLTGLSIKDEATMFYNLDTARVGLSGEALFRALLVAEDPDAVAIERAIVDAGLRVSYHGGIVDGVRCFKTLLYQAHTHGIDRIATALRVLHGAWPGQTNVVTAAVMEGLILFLRVYPDVDEKELSRQLSITSPKDLLLASREFSQSMSWNTSVSMAQAILAAYNYHRHAANRLATDAIVDFLAEQRTVRANQNRDGGYTNRRKLAG